MKKHGSMKQAIVLAALSLLFFACIAGFYIDRIRNSLITDLKHNVQEISASTTTRLKYGFMIICQPWRTYPICCRMSIPPIRKSCFRH